MAQHLHKQVLHDTCDDLECEEQLSPEISRVVQKNFNIGFEYLTEVIKLLSGKLKIKENIFVLLYG